MTGLIYLDISDNKLRALPNTLRQLINLESFECYENKIEAFPDGLEAWEKLNYIDYDDNPLKSIPDHLKKIDKRIVNKGKYSNLGLGLLLCLILIALVYYWGSGTIS